MITFDRVNKKKSKVLLLLSVLFLIYGTSSAAGFVRTNSTFNSIGFYIDSVNLKYSNRVSVSAEFMGSDNVVRKCLPVEIIDRSGLKMAVGTLVLLKENSTYTVSIKVYDSTTSTTDLITKTIKTLPEITFLGTKDTLWVSALGSGSVYSKNNPGNIEQLFKTDHGKIKCGTTVLCKEGNYFVGDLSYNINFTSRPCADKSQPIYIVGENDNVVFNGEDTAKSKWSNWSVYDASNHIYKITVNAEDDYSTELLMDGHRLFPYACIYTVAYGIPIPTTKYYFESLNDQLFGSGFYHVKNVFYVKLANNENPSSHVFTVSKRTGFLSIYNQSLPLNQKFVFRNLKFNNYSKPNLQYDIFNNVSYEGAAVALAFNNVSDVVLDNLGFEFNTMSVAFNGIHNNILIQNCKVKDETGTWKHGQFKNTALTRTGDLGSLFNSNDQGRFGRILEYSAIWFEVGASASANIVLRNCVIDGPVNGIGGRTNRSFPNFDIDVYNNTFKNCYDALDGIGDEINVRIWQNTFDNNPVNMSFIEAPEGPVYVFRNVFKNICDRNNIVNKTNSFNPELYVNHSICNEKLETKTWGTLLKLNSGTAGTPNPQLTINLFHNTIVSKDTLGYNFFISGNENWKKIRSINNAYTSKFTNFVFSNINQMSDYAFYSSSDNFYSEKNNIAKVEPIHVSNCLLAALPDSLYACLKRTTTNNNTNLLWVKSKSSNPNFVDLTKENYALTNQSNLIDGGELVPNISDLSGVNYLGNKPDIGAFESGISKVKRNAESFNTIEIFPNPASAKVLVKCNSDISNVQLLSIDGKLLYQFEIKNKLGNTCECDLSNFKSGIYLLKVSNGNGIQTKKLLIQD